MVYSAWCRKCIAKGIEVKDLRDVAQLRVVLHPHTGGGSAPWPGTDDKQLCYHVMGLVSTRLLLLLECPFAKLTCIPATDSAQPRPPCLVMVGTISRLAGMVHPDMRSRDVRCTRCGRPSRGASRTT